MAKSLSITCQGKNHAVKILPMQPLQAIVEEVAAKQKPLPALADCALLIDGKAADLSTPLRFANIPSSAKLEVTTGQTTKLGIQNRTQQEAQASAQGQSSSGPAETAAASKQPAQMADARLESQSKATALPARAPSSSQDEALAPRSSHSSAQQMELAVFLREDLEASSSGRGSEEYPDAFYDFGLDDYASVVKGYKASKQRAEAGLKTAKMREQEQLKLASKFPHTCIRVFLPDGFVLQMKFGVLDTIATVKTAVSRCLSPQIKAGTWHLYVTPPKQVLKDDKVTLLQAKLLPAAKLYLGSSDCERNSFLNSETQALRSEAPAANVPRDLERKAENQGELEAKPEAKPIEAKIGNSSARKVPKWLKTSR